MGGVRIAGIQGIVAEIEIYVSVELIRAGLGENFDTAVAQLVEFRRERILVDADFANGILGRQCSAGKSVDVDLASTRPGGRACQRFQIGL